MRSADYTYEIKDQKVYITDLNLGSVSVTNDTENVLSEINYYEDITQKRIFYRDSEDTWDEIIPTWDDDGKCDNVNFVAGNKISVCAISDLHGFLPEIKQSDILIIAGDISPMTIQFNIPEAEKWMKDTFIPWINSLPVEKVYLIAGNHDSIFRNLSKVKINEFCLLTNNKLCYLKNESAKYISSTGITYTLFGTPYCHIYGNWPFMISEEALTAKFAAIPDKVDILITHDAPYGLELQDVCLEHRRITNRYEHIGNVPLMDRLSQIKYKWLFHGHLHTSDHIPSEYNGGKVVNVSYVDEFNSPSYEPFYTKITKFANE